jgi:hypothetical protein
MAGQARTRELFRAFQRWGFDERGWNRFVARLYLHSGQDEAERIGYWSNKLGIPPTRFGKTYVKPEGSGHRKNVLWAGTVAIRIRRSTADLQRVLGWIEGLRAIGCDPEGLSL